MKTYNPLLESRGFDIPRLTKKVNDTAKKFVSNGLHQIEYKDFIYDMLGLLNELGVLKKDVLPEE